MSMVLVNARRSNAALKQLPELAKVEAKKTMNATAEKVEGLAKSKAPFLTGLLRRSIQWAERKLGAVVGIGSARDFVWVGERASARSYWKFVEFGTKHVQGRSFFRSSALAVESTHRRNMEIALTRASEKMERLA